MRKYQKQQQELLEKRQKTQGKQQEDNDTKINPNGDTDDLHNSSDNDLIMDDLTHTLRNVETLPELLATMRRENSKILWLENLTAKQISASAGNLSPIIFLTRMDDGSEAV